MRFTTVNYSLFSCFLIVLSSVSSYGHYWQQEVRYEMSIDMDVKTNRFKGHQILRYKNNSPDTLYRVFYHLYFNAFQPGSMMDVRNQTLPDSDRRVGDRISKLLPHEYGYQHVLSLSQNGKDLEYKEVGTILEVELIEPILPGQSSTFEMQFEAQVPLQIRRSGRDSKEGIRYSMTQWYPKLCEYDDQGWHANPYVGREFYGVWGDFDVKIYIARDYILGATGTLVNAKDIGYGYSDRQKKPKKARKKKAMWHFVAKKVHDFAWAADPDYVHRTLKTQAGTVFHFIYQPDTLTEKYWPELPAIMDRALTYLNDHFGVYPYDHYTFIQGGDGGMEYPMITLITGRRSLNSLVGVSVHELLHSWYQGVLATNESLYAWMDEGFTSYASDRTMNYLRCEGILEGDCLENVFESSINNYVAFNNAGRAEPLSTHADHFTTNAAYGVGSYVTGKLFLPQLEYIIGTDAFNRGMLRYFDEWQFKHPRPNDFFRIMEKESGMELDWYYEYWINTTALPDYAIDSVYQEGNDDVISLAKLGRMPMPVDVSILYENDEVRQLTIPLRIMRGAKTEENGIRYQVQEDWPWTHPFYQLRLAKGKAAIKAIAIDASYRMVDKNRDNNYWIAQKNE